MGAPSSKGAAMTMEGTKVDAEKSRTGQNQSHSQVSVLPPCTVLVPNLIDLRIYWMKHIYQENLLS